MVVRAGPAQQRPNPGEQLLVGERFHEVVVGAGVEALHAIIGAAESREHEDRNLRGRTKPAAHAHAVEAREHDVEHDQVERLVAGKPQRLQAVSDLLDAVPLGGQHAIEGSCQPGVILHDQDPGAVHLKSYISAA